MKKTMIVVFTLIFAFSLSAMAQTSSGTLTVTATVADSLNLVFNTDASGAALTGAGTNAATLAFGTISAYGTIATTNVTRTVNGTTDFTVSSPVDVHVTMANSNGSANYTLTAQLGTADATNTWSVGGKTINDTAATSITATGAYNSDVAQSIALKVPFTESAGAISNTINFVATAN